MSLGPKLIKIRRQFFEISSERHIEHIWTNRHNHRQLGEGQVYHLDHFQKSTMSSLFQKLQQSNFSGWSPVARSRHWASPARSVDWCRYRSSQYMATPFCECPSISRLATDSITATPWTRIYVGDAVRRAYSFFSAPTYIIWLGVH